MTCPGKRFEFDGVQFDRLTRAQILNHQTGSAAWIAQTHLHIGEFATKHDPVAVRSRERGGAGLQALPRGIVVHNGMLKLPR